MGKKENWAEWAAELQSLAQAGLYYSKDPYDRERFQRIREIAGEIVSEKTGLSAEEVNVRFCSDMGYQTPKLVTRAAVFQDDKILLVRETDGLWSLPGGWVDYDLSVKENAVKETKEEAGLDVRAERVIALLDKDRHNPPPYPFKVCNVYVLCSLLGGTFQENLETTESGFFGLDELPPLSEEKNNLEQIEMCFRAYGSENWETILD